MTEIYKNQPYWKHMPNISFEMTFHCNSEEESIFVEVTLETKWNLKYIEYYISY